VRAELGEHECNSRLKAGFNISVDIHCSSMYKTGMLAKDMVAASAKPLLLSILAEGESYGYEIIQKVRELSGGQIEWSDGMLYPVLHRLERDGLVDSEWKESDTGRERKYYSLSSDGRKVLKTERQQWLTVHNTLSKLWKIKPVTI
jgi:PadR family transcriptional regulator PadR